MKRVKERRESYSSLDEQILLFYITLISLSSSACIVQKLKITA